MRHPSEFYFCFDPAMYDPERERRVVASASLSPKLTMADGNIVFMFPPDNKVTYLMIEYQSSRGEAEFILYWYNHDHSLP